MFTNILTNSTGTLTLGNTLICTLTSLVLGLIISYVYMNSGNYTKNFVVSLVLLPALVQCVIMMVNGNLGTSVAVLGTFSLVRFRSAPGTSKDIICIFFAMAIGLSTGMGYLTFASMITVVLSTAMLILYKLPYGGEHSMEKELKVTIPENLDYTDVFDDLFAEYTKSAKLDRVKTTNMGSMYELCYKITLRDNSREKEFIDALRCRNGNLTIVCGRPKLTGNEL